MRRRVSGIEPVKSVCSLRSRALVALLLLPVAGCASNTPHDAHVAQMGVAGPPQQVAAAPPIDLEDDGLPAQTPPRLRRPQSADDPSEPFSPNYGRSPAVHDTVDNDGDQGSQIESAPRKTAKQVSKRSDAHASLAMPTPALPNDLPPAFKARLVATLDKYE